MVAVNGLDGDDKDGALLLHFDVNKTVILTDSIDMRTQDECIREGVSELFWGLLTDHEQVGLTWLWLGEKTTGSLAPDGADRPPTECCFHVRSWEMDVWVGHKEVQTFRRVF